MSTTYNCLAIDDDPLFLRTLDIYIESLDWLNLVATYNNPIQGAKAIFDVNPDILFLDMEMPYVDGNYLVDWIGPRLKKMDKPPKIIIISSLNFTPEEKVKGVAGYINKGHVTNAERLGKLIREIID
ncbi:MAG: chemotaxis response regulator CheB [Marinoscillum sp.]|jgi:chemotaxis response regulator CheB